MQWIIDPLDGTSNYSIHNPFYCVSIALFQDEKPILGVIYAPATDELFHAVRGGGAFLNGIPCKVKSVDSLKKSFISFCNGKDQESRREISEIFKVGKEVTNNFRLIGAAALELAYVAAGRIDGFVMAGVNFWDVAAGVVLVIEAGGIASDFNLDDFVPKSSDLVAGSSEFVKLMTQLIREN